MCLYVLFYVVCNIYLKNLHLMKISLHQVFCFLSFYHHHIIHAVPVFEMLTAVLVHMHIITVSFYSLHELSFVCEPSCQRGYPRETISFHYMLIIVRSSPLSLMSCHNNRSSCNRPRPPCFCAYKMYDMCPLIPWIIFCHSKK